MIPTNTLIVIVGIVLMALAVAMMIPPIRHYATDRLLPLVKAYARQLIERAHQSQGAVVQRAGHADPQRGHRTGILGGAAGVRTDDQSAGDAVHLPGRQCHRLRGADPPAASVASKRR